MKTVHGNNYKIDFKWLAIALAVWAMAWFWVQEEREETRRLEIKTHQSPNDEIKDPVL